MQSFLRPIPRPLRIAVGAFCILLVALPLGAWLLLRAGLPPLDGRRQVQGLIAPVDLSRDGDGVVILQAESFPDALFALGFAHGQDRFFQMDLRRRNAAGRLAELVGQVALPLDRRRRAYRFEAVARREYQALSAPQREWLDAYTAGVNGGLTSLASRPPEYWLLRQRPVLWQSYEAYLVLASMFCLVQDEENELELLRGVMPGVFGDSLSAFLDPPGDRFDSALAEDRFLLGEFPGFSASPIPGGDSIPTQARSPRGSNGWVISGELRPDGRAILANDTHLPLGLPATWYRCALRVGNDFRFDGVSMPGLPVLAVGGNGSLAWGITVNYADQMDWLEVGASLKPAWHQEILHSSDAPPETLRVAWAHGGPLYEADALGPRRVLQWVALQPGGMDFLPLLEMAQSHELEAALDLAAASGVPGLNMLFASADGRIGMGTVGRLPRRQGEGFLDPSLAPRSMDPPEGFLWNANHRSWAGEALQLLGDSGWSQGARASQIRLRLEEQRAAGLFSVEEQWATQLDDEALLMQRWAKELRRFLETSHDPIGKELLPLLDAWDGHASSSSVTYRLVRSWRLRMMGEMWRPLETRLRAGVPGLSLSALPRRESASWAMLEQKPDELLAGRWTSWEEMALDQARAILDDIKAAGETLENWTWGEENQVHFRHPLANALPSILARRFALPARGLPGDDHMPRVQDGLHGAALRLVLSPGREDQALLHIPAGQSGHTLSCWWGNFHRSWEEGIPTPLLPGKIEHTLHLEPKVQP